MQLRSDSRRDGDTDQTLLEGAGETSVLIEQQPRVARFTLGHLDRDHHLNSPATNSGRQEYLANQLSLRHEGILAPTSSSEAHDDSGEGDSKDPEHVISNV